MNPRCRTLGKELSLNKKVSGLLEKLKGYLELYKETKKKLKEDPFSKLVYEQALKNIAKELNKGKMLLEKLKYNGELTLQHQDKYKKTLEEINRRGKEFDSFLSDDDLKEESQDLPDLGLTPIVPLNNPILKNYNINKGYEVISLIASGRDFDEIAKETGVPIEIFIGWSLRITDFKKMFHNALFMRSWVLAERMKSIVDNCADDNNAVKKAKLQTDVYRFLIAHYAPKEWGESEVLRQAMITVKEEEAGIGGVQILLPSNGRDLDEHLLKEIPEKTEEVIEVEEFQSLVSDIRGAEEIIGLQERIPPLSEYNLEKGKG